MTTSAPLDEVTIANMAIDVLSDIYINDLSEDGPVPEFMNLNFGPVRDELLQMFPWNFAKSRELVASSGAPAFGWKYQCLQPSDMIAPLEIRCSGEWNYDPVPFEYEGEYILTDYTPPVPLIYTRRVTNASKFSPLFARTLANRLAWYAAQTVTGKDSFITKARDMMFEAFEQGKLAESLAAGTPQEQFRSDILSVRGLTADTAELLARTY